MNTSRRKVRSVSPGRQGGKKRSHHGFSRSKTSVTEDSLKLQPLPHRFSKRKMAILERIDKLDHARIQRLRRAARVGQIVFTKQGIFETVECKECKTHHKLNPSLRLPNPCPASEFGKKYHMKHVHKLSARHMLVTCPVRLNNTSIQTQTKIGAAGGEDANPPVVLLTRPKTARGRDSKKQRPFNLPECHDDSSSPTSPNRASDTDKTMSDSFMSSDSQVHMPEIVPVQNSSSDWSSEYEEEMAREVFREMFSQEEDALRIRLARDKERFKQVTHNLKECETKFALSEVRKKSMVRDLQKEVYYLMEREVILGITKVSLNEEYKRRLGAKKRAQHTAHKLAESHNKTQQLLENKKKQVLSEGQGRNTNMQKKKTTMATTTPLKSVMSSSKYMGTTPNISDTTLSHDSARISEYTHNLPRPLSAHPSRRPDLAYNIPSENMKISFNASTTRRIPSSPGSGQDSSTNHITSPPGSVPVAAGHSDTSLESAALNIHTSSSSLFHEGKLDPTEKQDSSVGLLSEPSFTRTRRKPSLIEHVDSLILLEQSQSRMQLEQAGDNAQVNTYTSAFPKPKAQSKSPHSQRSKSPHFKSPQSSGSKSLPDSNTKAESDSRSKTQHSKAHSDSRSNQSNPRSNLPELPSKALSEPPPKTRSNSRFKGPRDATRSRSKAKSSSNFKTPSADKIAQQSKATSEKAARVHIDDPLVMVPVKKGVVAPPSTPVENRCSSRHSQADDVDDCVCATEGTHKLDKTQVIMVSPCGGTAEEEKKLGAPVTEEVTDSDVSHVTLEAITKEVTVPDGATNATLTEICIKSGQSLCSTASTTSTNIKEIDMTHQYLEGAKEIWRSSIDKLLNPQNIAGISASFAGISPSNNSVTSRSLSLGSMKDRMTAAISNSVHKLLQKEEKSLMALGNGNKAAICEYAKELVSNVTNVALYEHETQAIKSGGSPTAGINPEITTEIARDYASSLLENVILEYLDKNLFASSDGADSVKGVEGPSPLILLRESLEMLKKNNADSDIGAKTKKNKVIKDPDGDGDNLSKETEVKADGDEIKAREGEDTKSIKEDSQGSLEKRKDEVNEEDVEVKDCTDVGMPRKFEEARIDHQVGSNGDAEEDKIVASDTIEELTEGEFKVEIAPDMNEVMRMVVSTGKDEITPLDTIEEVSEGDYKTESVASGANQDDDNVCNIHTTKLAETRIIHVDSAEEKDEDNQVDVIEELEGKADPEQDDLIKVTQDELEATDYTQEFDTSITSIDDEREEASDAAVEDPKQSAVTMESEGKENGDATETDLQKNLAKKADGEEKGIDIPGGLSEKSLVGDEQEIWFISDYKIDSNPGSPLSARPPSTSVSVHTTGGSVPIVVEGRERIFSSDFDIEDKKQSTNHKSTPEVGVDDTNQDHAQTGPGSSNEVLSTEVEEEVFTTALQGNNNGSNVASNGNNVAQGNSEDEIVVKETFSASVIIQGSIWKDPRDEYMVDDARDTEAEKFSTRVQDLKDEAHNTELERFSTLKDATNGNNMVDEMNNTKVETFSTVEGSKEGHILNEIRNIKLETSPNLENSNMMDERINFNAKMDASSIQEDSKGAHMVDNTEMESSSTQEDSKDIHMVDEMCNTEMESSSTQEDSKEEEHMINETCNTEMFSAQGDPKDKPKTDDVHKTEIQTFSTRDLENKVDEEGVGVRISVDTAGDSDEVYVTSNIRAEDLKKLDVRGDLFSSDESDIDDYSMKCHPSDNEQINSDMDNNEMPKLSRLDCSNSVPLIEVTPCSSNEDRRRRQVKRTLKEKASTSNNKRNDARCNSDKYNSQPPSEGGAGHPLKKVRRRVGEIIAGGKYSSSDAHYETPAVVSPMYPSLSEISSVSSGSSHSSISSRSHRDSDDARILTTESSSDDGRYYKTVTMGSKWKRGMNVLKKVTTKGDGSNSSQKPPRTFRRYSTTKKPRPHSDDDEFGTFP